MTAHFASLAALAEKTVEELAVAGSQKIERPWEEWIDLGLRLRRKPTRHDASGVPKVMTWPKVAAWILTHDAERAAGLKEASLAADLSARVAARIGAPRKPRRRATIAPTKTRRLGDIAP